MSICLQLPLRSSHIGMFLQEIRPETQPSRCIFRYRCSATVVKFLENTCDGVKFWVNLHVKFSSFEPLLRKLYLITALINAEQKFLQNTSRKLLMFRSSGSKMFLKIGVLKNFANLTGKHLCWSLFLIQTLLDSADSVKKRLQHRCYLVKLAKFLRWLFLLPEQLTNPVLTGNNFTKNFTADVPVGILRNVQNNIHSFLCCFHKLFEILNYTIFCSIVNNK